MASQEDKGAEKKAAAVAVKEEGEKEKQSEQAGDASIAGTKKTTEDVEMKDSSPTADAAGMEKASGSSTTDAAASNDGAVTMEDTEKNEETNNTEPTTTTKTDQHQQHSSGFTKGGGGRYSNNNNRGGARTSRRHAPYYNNRGVVYRVVGGEGGGGGAGDGSAAAADAQSRRVYVGNLAWGVTWRQLKDHMKTTGHDVTRADVMASPDGRSKGAGIVEFATQEGAQAAVLTLNDTELMGRQIFVREDREDGSSGGYYVQQTSGGGDYHSGGGGGGGPRNYHHHGGDGGGGGEAAQSRRCYVGNLSWDVAWQDLKDHMRQAGEVAYAEVMMEPDGRSKGCGIVEYATAEEAQTAIRTLTETDLNGRTIFVREDRETGGSGGGGGGGGGGRSSNMSVYVGNLSYETTWMELKDHMRGAGNVDKADILMSEDGRSKGCGIVLYQRPQDAARAIRELQKSMLNGRPIFVREDREARGGGPRGGGGGHHHHQHHHHARDDNEDNTGGGGGGCQLFVRNLSYDTDWKELKDHFSQSGQVERADVMVGPDGRKKGFGIVRFYNETDAHNAKEQLNGVELQGRPLDIRIDRKASK